MRHWVLGEFDHPDAAIEALRRLKDAGGRSIDLHSPYPIESANAVLGLRGSPIPALALVGGLGAVAAAFLVQWFTNAVDYPLNVGGRPLNSAPAFVPITFELGVLGAAGAIFVGLFVVMRLPQLYHPVFDIDRFVTMSVDRFWVSLPVEGGRDACEPWMDLLRTSGALEVAVVEERT